jgi:hypothetical protein
MRRIRFVARVASCALGLLAASSSVGACTCKKDAASDGRDSSADAAVLPPSADARATEAPGAKALPRLSAPIGAALLPSDAVVIAGLVVPERVVRVSLLEKDGRVSWTTDVVTGAEWTHDAELAVHPVGKDVVVTFRGKVDGAPKRTVVRVAADGTANPPKAFGAVTCWTANGLFWLDGHKRVRSESGLGLRDLALPSGLEGDLSLFCDETHATVVLDADGALSTLDIGTDTISPAVALMGEKDFSDEEREHAFFFGKSGLGLLRVGGDGSLATKYAGAAGRKLTGKLDEDDDLVVVDADERSLYAVATQDHDGCASGEDASALPTQRTSRFSTSVRLLRLDLESGQSVREELGRAACGHQAGAFFFGAAKDKRMLAWTERAPTAGKTKAPIAALAYRVLGASPADTRSHRVEVSADALVDAGCTTTTCAVVWLDRPSGKDDKEPELPKVLRFPE